MIVQTAYQKAVEEDKFVSSLSSFEAGWDAARADLEATIAEQAAEIERLQREVVNRNQRALDGDIASKSWDQLYDQLTAEQSATSIFIEVINHAITQGCEAGEFLRCWREGDIKGCAEYDYVYRE